MDDMIKYWNKIRQLDDDDDMLNGVTREIITNFSVPCFDLGDLINWFYYNQSNNIRQILHNAFQWNQN